MGYAPYPLGALADEATRLIDWNHIHGHIQEKNQ